MDRAWKYLIFILVWMVVGVAIIFGQVLPLMLPFTRLDEGALSVMVAVLCWWFIGTFSFFWAEGSFR